MTSLDHVVDQTDESAAGPGAGVGFPVAAVASRVGVATSTLRSWERRYGVGPSGRSGGGHRRYTNADIALLQRVRGLVRSGMPTAAAATLALTSASASGNVQPRPPGSHAGALDSVERQFSAASEVLDTRRLARIAALALTRHGAVNAWTKVFTPQLQTLGDRWAHTGGAIEREHATAAVVQAALARHAERHLPARATAVVLAAATQNEHHTLPLNALAAALAEYGVATCLVGTVPPTALHTAICDSRPAAVILWARSVTTTDTATLRSLLPGAPAICAAGPGWQPSHLPTGVIHVTDLPTAVQSVLDLTWHRPTGVTGSRAAVH